jgi:hypothetical protein
MAATNVILVPVYAIGSRQLIDRTTYPFGMSVAFGSTSVVAQPNTGDGSVNSLEAARTRGAALVYSRVSSPAFPNTVFFSNLTVSAIQTLANA